MIKNDTVSLLKCEEYDIDILFHIINQHFENLGGLEKIIPQNSSVVIKPNLVAAEKPEKGATSHPVFLAALIKVLKRQTSNIKIAESPGGPGGSMFFKTVCKVTGISSLDCEIVYEPKITEVLVPDGVKCKRFEVLKDLVDADIIISAAKLKTHGMMTYTGAVKNMFGAIFGLEKTEFHFKYNQKDDFADMLVDLCLAVTPTISFVDGIIGMDGNGPTGGSPKKANCVIAALNPYALDFVASDLAGIDKNIIPLNQKAIKRGLCPDDLSKIDIVGDDIELLRCKYTLPDSITNDVNFKFMKILPPKLIGFIAKKLSPLPHIDNLKCVGCGICAKSCPQKIINIKNKKAIIKTQKCIRCYCCQEMCPHEAVYIVKKNHKK